MEFVKMNVQMEAIKSLLEENASNVMTFNVWTVLLLTTVLFVKICILQVYTVKIYYF